MGKNICVIVCLLFVNNSFSQNNYNWITPNKTYLKLYINTDGVYRINGTDFTNAGINISTIDPHTVKVLHKGNQIPIYFSGEDDGTFENNDFLDFCGSRNYGGLTPRRDGFSNNIMYNVDEYYNLYSDTNIYWIDWGGNNGLRMHRSNFTSAINYPDDNFFKKVHFEKDLFYYLGETTNPAADYRHFSTELVVGEGWFWSGLTTDQSLTETVFINDLIPNAQICSLKLFAKPASFTDQVFNEHRLEIKINNTIVDTLERNNLTRLDTTIIFNANLLSNNSVNSVTLHYIPLGNQFFYPQLQIDFFELFYQRDFTIRDNNLSIRLNGTDTTSKVFTLQGYNSSLPVNIYDKKNNIRIESYSGNQNTLTFTGKSNSEFEIQNQNISLRPFRIVSKQVPDLVSNTNSANYLIVYNKLFESQSEQLKNHRQSFDNYNVIKAEVENIYDIFNYGFEDPVAIRNFTKYAYENWQAPKLEYLCLFGRASLDPKKNSSSSVYYQNLIPTYGNPPTDGYFANFNIGTFTYYHQISVGRLPVYDAAEAQGVVDKVISYDTRKPDKWWKKYIAITGGGTRNEQLLFQGKSENLLNNYIVDPPPCMQVARIYRNDSAGFITYNYKDSIIKEINRGALMINFIGHAAAQDWEIGLQNPNELNNGERQPLVLSFTCFTGKNAETHERSFGEKFVSIANKCAIAFIGSTGWSFSGVGDLYDDLIHKRFSDDSVRAIGDLVSYSTVFMSTDSGSFASRNTINCYNLLGDPATKLLMPGKPEFDITEVDYTLSNSFPALGETVKLTIFPKNLGTSVDSFKVRFNLKKDGVIRQSKDTLINGFCYIDSIDHYFSIDTIGNYTMTVSVDPDKVYPQIRKYNDSITFPLSLRNLSYVQIKPLDNAVLSSNSFRFTGLNPNLGQGSSVKVILQVDTSRYFDSPALQTYHNKNISGITSSFDVNIPITEINMLYFLRTNAIINDDSSGWTAVRRIIYNPAISDKSNAAIDSAYSIYSLKPGQYEPTEITNLIYTFDGFVLSKINGAFTSHSHGSNGSEASFFTINNGIANVNYFSDGGLNTGLNLAKVRKINGAISEIKNFRMNSSSSSDSVVNFLNTFSNNEYLLGYVASYVPDSDSLRGNAKTKFRKFGSIYADSISRFDRFTTWAFIGYLGADTSQTEEKFHNYFSNNVWEALTVQTFPVLQITSGSISQTYGTADTWKNFSWDQTLLPNTSISFDVYGIDRDNKTQLLYSNISTNSFVNIDTLDSYAYPGLTLVGKINIDTLLGLESPVYKSLTFKYVPPVELTPDNNSFQGKDTIVQEGDTVRFSVNYYNVGFKDAEQYITKWYVKNLGDEDTLGYEIISTPLKIDSMSTSSVKFSTSGLRDPKLPADTIDLYFEVSMKGDKNEIFAFNNTAITKFVLTGDTVNPLIEATYDGLKIQNGDFVQAKPTIHFKLLDDSRMVVNDTSNVKVYLDNKYVPYYLNGVKNPLIDISFPDNLFLQALVTFNPELAKGTHKVRCSAIDLTGNIADSIVNLVVVDDKLRIHDIANYPNPMKNETSFMFMLSGDLNPTSCKVKIYTVTGRLIKEINTPAFVGYNRIYWDGKDDDGDHIANGTYLYKFIIQGNSQIETSIQKLAILR